MICIDMYNNVYSDPGGVTENEALTISFVGAFSFMYK